MLLASEKFTLQQSSKVFIQSEEGDYIDIPAMIKEATKREWRQIILSHIDAGFINEKWTVSLIERWIRLPDHIDDLENYRLGGFPIFTIRGTNENSI